MKRKTVTAFMAAVAAAGDLGLEQQPRPRIKRKPAGEGARRAADLLRKRCAAKGRVCTNGAREKARRRQQMARGLIKADAQRIQ